MNSNCDDIISLIAINNNTAKIITSFKDKDVTGTYNWKQKQIDTCSFSVVE